MVGRQRSSEAPRKSGDTALTDRTPKRRRIRVGDFLPIRVPLGKLLEGQGLEVPDQPLERKLRPKALPLRRPLSRCHEPLPDHE